MSQKENDLRTILRKRQDFCGVYISPMENGHSAPAVELLENFARATYLGRPNQPYCHVTVTFWGAYRTSAYQSHLQQRFIKPNVNTISAE